MKQLLKEFKRDENGAFTVWFLMGLVVILVITFSVFDVGEIVENKIDSQNIADMTAYSGAVWQARFLNIISVSNIAMSMCYVLIATIVLLTIVSCVLGAIPEFNVIFGVLCSTMLSHGPTWVDNLYKTAQQIDSVQDNLIENIAPGFTQVEAIRIALSNLNGQETQINIDVNGNTASNISNIINGGYNSNFGFVLGRTGSFEERILPNISLVSDGSMSDFMAGFDSPGEDPENWLVFDDSPSFIGTTAESIEQDNPRKLGRLHRVKDWKRGKKNRKTGIRGPRRCRYTDDRIYGYTRATLIRFKGDPITRKVDRIYGYGKKFGESGGWKKITKKPHRWERKFKKDLQCPHRDCKQENSHKHRVTFYENYITEKVENKTRLIFSNKFSNAPLPCSLESDWFNNMGLNSIVLKNNIRYSIISDDVAHYLTISEATPYSDSHNANKYLLLTPDWEAKLKKVTISDEIEGIGLPLDLTNSILEWSDGYILH